MAKVGAYQTVRKESGVGLGAIVGNRFVCGRCVFALRGPREAYWTVWCFLPPGLGSGKRFLFLLKRQRCRNRDHTNAKEAVAMPRLFSCFSIYRRETKKRTACAFVFASMAKGEGKGRRSVQAGASSTTAVARMPSMRPSGPRPSVVVALTLTALSSTCIASASRSRIAGM